MCSNTIIIVLYIFKSYKSKNNIDMNRHLQNYKDILKHITLSS